MGNKAEASLLLRIKEQGKEAITKVADVMDDVKTKAAIATAAIAGFIGVTVAKYADQEEAEKSLRQSLRAQGLQVDELAARYMALASAIQNKTTMDDTAIIKGIAIAQSFTGQLEITDELIKATVDFAAATGTDLEQAFTMVGKSIGTSTNALARNGVELSEASNAADRMQSVIAQLNVKWGGWAESQRDGLGELKALKENFDDLAEAVGKEFAPSLSDAAKELNKVISNLSSEQIQKLAKWTAGILAAAGAMAALVTAVAALGAALPALATGFELIVGFLTGPIGLAVALTSIATAAGVASGAFDGLIQKAKVAVGLAAPDLKERADGNYVDEKSAYMERRAKDEMARVSKQADHEIAEEKRAAAEKAKEAADLAEKKKKYDEDYLKELRKAEGEYQEWKEKEEEKAAKKRLDDLKAAYENPIKVLFEPQTIKDVVSGNGTLFEKEELANAGIGIATSFLSAIQKGAEGTKQFGAGIAEGVGNAIQDKLNNSLGDGAIFGLGGLFKELFMFSAQSEEAINAQTKAFVQAAPAIAEAQAKFAPAMVEALIDAIGDPEFLDAFIRSAGRAMAANTDAIARQWGIKSGEEFIDKVGGWFKEFFGAIGDFFQDFFGNFFTNMGMFFQSLWTDLGNLGSNLGAAFKDIFGSAATSIATQLNGAFDNIGSKISGLFNNVLDNSAINAGGILSSSLENTFTNIRQSLGEEMNQSRDKLKDAFNYGKETFTSAFKWLGDSIDDLKSFFSNVDIFDSLTSAVDKLSEAFKKLSSATNVGDNIKSFADKILGRASGGIVPGYATGGFVMPAIQKFAAGGTTDTVPAMLTPGEFVVNRDATKQNLGLLQSINAGGSGGGGAVINLTINGGFLGDEASARQLAQAIDQQLLKLRQGNRSLAFDSGVV